MKQFRAWIFLAMVGLGMGASLGGCIWEEGRGGGGGHHHRD
jgi:hypothetical protein